MERFASAAVGLARAFEEVRRDLPPPPALDGAIEAWRELWRRLGAERETARMRIDGRLGALAAEVRVAFDEAGQPMTTWLSVRPPSPLDEAHRFHWTAGQRDLDDAIGERFEGEAFELMQIVTRGAREVEIEPARLALCLPDLLGTPGALDAARAEQRLSRMGRLLSVLRGQVGPYR